MGSDDREPESEALIDKLQSVAGPDKAEPIDAIEGSDPIEEVESIGAVREMSESHARRVRNRLAGLARNAVRGEYENDAQVRRRAIEIVVESKFEGALDETNRRKAVETLVEALGEDTTFVSKLEAMMVEASRADREG